VQAVVIVTVEPAVELVAREAWVAPAPTVWYPPEVLDVDIHELAWRSLIARDDAGRPIEVAQPRQRVAPKDPVQVGEPPRAPGRSRAFEGVLSPTHDRPFPTVVEAVPAASAC
jgi:hypothetical protein